MLARFFGWTLDQICDMTPAEIDAIAASLQKESEEQNDGNLHFSTVEEWRMWREMQGIK